MNGIHDDEEEPSPERFAKTLIAALNERDGLTREHSDRVVTLAQELGRRCGLSERELRLLGLAAAMHDIGKIGIPDHILLKPGGFDAGEWAVMKSHAVRGERILNSIDSEGMGEVAVVVRHHHEHYDGSGYPDSIAGETIPILSRILSIVDSYDAMATPRPYHRARSVGEVMSILEQERGAKHDPAVLKRFRPVLAS
jgi:HD-GYP domain-containing protein (c-di-GMP phosphodiesterase class II)